MYNGEEIFRKSKLSSYSEFYLVLCMSKILKMRGEVLDVSRMIIDYDLLPGSYIDLFKRRVKEGAIYIGEGDIGSVNMYEKIACDIDVSYFDEINLFREVDDHLYWNLDTISHTYGKYSSKAYNMLNMGYFVSNLVSYHILNIFDGKENRKLVLDFDKSQTGNSYIYVNIISCLRSMGWLNKFVAVNLDLDKKDKVDIDYSIFCMNGAVAGHKKLWSVKEKLALMEKQGMSVGSILILWYRKGINANNKNGVIDRAIVIRLDEIGDTYIGVTSMALNKTKEEVYQDYMSIDPSIRSMFVDMIDKKPYMAHMELDIVGFGVDNYFDDEDKFITKLDTSERVYKRVTIDGVESEVEMSAIDAFYWLLCQYGLDFDKELYKEMYFDGETPLWERYN